MTALNRLRPVVIALAFLMAFPLVTAPSAIAQDSTPAAPVAPATPADYDRTGWPEELNCGLFGGDDAEAALSAEEPLANYISEWVGLPIEYTVGTSYNAVIESMRSGFTNCGTVGPFSYILAVEEADAEALAVMAGTGDPGTGTVYDPAVRPSYFSVISVKKGSGIASVADLRGHSFSFVDPASTSGFLIPSATMIAAGLDPETDVESVFSGSHATSGLALWNDKVDAAATTEATLYNLAQEGQIDFCGFEDGEIGKDRTDAEIQAVYDACPDGSVVAIDYSDPIPNTPFAVRADMPDSLKQAIKDALLNIRNNPELVDALGYWYIDPNIEYGLGLPDLDAYYDPLRVIAEQLDLDLEGIGS